MRVFIGIPFNDETIKGIENIQKQLKSLPAKCKYVEPENFHICISFLGEIELEKLNSIKKSVIDVCKRHGKFKVKATGIKLIPNVKHIRVVAIGIGSEGDKLENITKDINMVSFGDSKPSHITLCRVKKIFDKEEFIKIINGIEIDLGEIEVDYMDFVKSDLSPNGPEYTTLERIELL